MSVHLVIKCQMITLDERLQVLTLHWLKVNVAGAITPPPPRLQMMENRLLVSTTRFDKDLVQLLDLFLGTRERSQLNEIPSVTSLHLQ